MSISNNYECSICCDTFDINEVYKCPGCGDVICYDCLRTQIMEYSNLQPHCFECNTLIYFKHIIKAITHTKSKKNIHAQSKEYFTKIAEQRFINEQQMIPSVMPACTLIKEAKSIRIIIPNYISNALSNCIMRYNPNSYHYPEISDELNAIYINNFMAMLTHLMHTTNDSDKQQISNMDLSTLFNMCSMNISRLIREIYKVFNIEITKDNCNFDYMKLLFLSEYDIIMSYFNKYINKSLGKSIKNKYIFRCSFEDCKGYVNCEYECELCHNKYCPECWKILNEFHECNKDDIESVKLIMNSTKPCPKCASRIHKFEGCSQMFCTNCHTGFDYNTGKIITTNFHNPHRMEWLAQHGDVLRNDVNECVEVHRLIDKRLMWYLYQRNDRRDYIRKYRSKFHVPPSTIYMNRCYFVLNTFSEDKYKSVLEKEEINKKKLEMLENIYNEYDNNITLILTNAHNLERENYDSFHKFIDNIFDIGNDEHMTYSFYRLFNCTEFKDFMLNYYTLDDTEFKNKLTEIHDRWGLDRYNLIKSRRGHNEVPYQDSQTLDILFDSYLDKLIKNRSKIVNYCGVYDEYENLIKLLIGHVNDNIQDYNKIFGIRIHKLNVYDVHAYFTKYSS